MYDVNSLEWFGCWHVNKDTAGTLTGMISHTSADSKCLAWTGNSNGAISVWNVASRTEVQSVANFKACPTSSGGLFYTVCGVNRSFVWTADPTGNLLLWDSTSMNAVQELIDYHITPVHSVVCRKDRLFSVSSDGLIVVWKL